MTPPTEFDQLATTLFELIRTGRVIITRQFVDDFLRRAWNLRGKRDMAQIDLELNALLGRAEARQYRDHFRRVLGQFDL